MQTSRATSDSNDVIIVGAGPAGLGLAIALEDLGITPRILEARGIGAAFRAWPKQTHLLSPSFPSDAYGCPDLNSVFPLKSPAQFCGTEHPAGKDYADWLENSAREAGLNVDAPVRVETVKTSPNGFELETTIGAIQCRCLVWATGEFFFPHRCNVPGVEFSLHYADVESWIDLPGDHFILVGGAESGIDAACVLVEAGKNVTVLDSTSAWESEEGDPSTVLSPRTRDRLRRCQGNNALKLVPDTRVTRIEQTGDSYKVFDQHGRFFETDTRTLLCCGFDGGAGQIHDLWDWDAGNPRLTDHDESIKTPGLFLVGPQVRHPGEIFCFIYKFRTRFSLVAKAIQSHLSEFTFRKPLNRDSILLEESERCK